MKILMVCLGNICRSPLAEGIMRDRARKAGLDWEVDSAGTNHYQTGCSPHKLSQKVANAHGVDICSLQCRQLTCDDILEFDKIYVMDKNNYYDVKRISKSNWDEGKVDLLLNEAFPGENREVPDPYHEGEEAYHQVFKMVEQACDNIIKKYAVVSPVR